MKKENIEKMIEKKQVDVSLVGERFTYYASPIMIFGFTILLILISLIDPKPDKSIPASILVLLIICAIIHFLKLRASCKFTIIQGQFTAQQVNIAVANIAKESGWHIFTNNKTIIRAWNNSGLDLIGYRGETITILPSPKEGRIYINSICTSHGAVKLIIGSFGRNKKNVNTFIVNLEKVTRKPLSILN